LWSAQAARGALYAVSDGCSAVGARKGQPLTLGSLKLKREGKAAVVASNGVLAGGATFLVEHPALLKRLADVTDENLKLYYSLQQKMFMGKCRCARLHNHFDARTLKHLGSEVSR
jgi:hypothetical protein